jgi:bromodomain-containing factor 1
VFASSLLTSAQLIRSTTHYDTLFEEPTQNGNGIHTDSMDTQSPPLTQDAVASDIQVVTAEDSSAAPITHVSSGIAPVASFLPDAGADELPVTETVPPQVEQPVSDVRSELQPLSDPMASEEAPVASIDRSMAEPVATESGAVLNPSGDSAPVMEESVVPEIASATEDTMDITEDVTVPQVTAADGITSTEQEPIPSVEVPVDEPQLPDAPATQESADAQMLGTSSEKVRPREEDEDESEPSAKRAKTETAEESSAINAPEASNEAPNATDATNGTGTVAVAAASGPVSFDSNPLTPIQHKYILEQVRKAKKIKFAAAFLKPVDFVALGIPNYPEVIKNPMDLSTMEDKLKKHTYSSADDLMTDFNLIVDNCVTFNGTAHAVSEAAINLKAYFYKNMSLMPTGAAANPPNPTPAPARPKKAAAPAPKKVETRPERKATVVPRSPVDSKSNVGFINSDGTPIIRRDSSAQHDRPKREIHPPKRDLPSMGARPKKKKHQLELKFCEQIVNEMVKKRYGSFAYPFLTPVDPVALNIPNYHKIIKKPMDFGTILSNLKTSQYANAKDFYADAQLVFQNCFKFNPPTDEVFKMGKSTQELFDKLWEGKEQYLIDNAPASEPASDAEDEDEEEEEEEDDEAAEKVRRMMEIQQQIAALSAEAMSLTTVAPKRASPKAPSKKSNKKAKTTNSKLARTNSIQAGPSTSSKSSKPKPKAKVRKLTLEQKREVSEGIAQLDEAQMRKAVQIIRNGVPTLRVSSLLHLLPRLYKLTNSHDRMSMTMN